MKNLRRILAVSLLVPCCAALLSMLPGAAAEAAGTTNRANTFAASKNGDFERGQKALRDGGWQEAVDYFKKAVADDAKNAEAYNLMGYSYRRLGEADPAFEAYAKALDLDPRHRGALEYLGQTYLLVGDLAQAEAQLARLKDLCLRRCREADKLRKAIARYNASADKQAGLDLDAENW